MDTLTPLLILAAKNAAENAEKRNVSSQALALSATLAAGVPVLSSACVASAAAMGTGLFSSLFSFSKTKPADKQENKAKDTGGSPLAVDDKLIKAVVECIKSELPAIIEAINSSPSQTIVSETYDAVYTSQIAKAQEFLNENHNADLSRVKCLLHKLLPKEYFDLIEQLREHQDPQTIFNIQGGQNIIAPNAERVERHFKKK